MYYTKDITEVLKECHSSLYGLNQQEVVKRQKQYGLNKLQDQKKESIFLIFLKQFQDYLVFILIISALVSGLSGQIESTIVILIVVILNAILGTLQTLKAQKSLESLKKLSVPHIHVLRDNQLQQIDASLLTIGDIVYVEAGDMISGDGRIIQCSSLKINESTLTGEVDSVEKTSQTLHHQVMIHDQKNMVFSSTLVTHGTGAYVVTNIGMKTELGKIASLLDHTNERKSPLQKSLDEFSQRLSIIILFICFIVLFLNLFLARESFLNALMIAVALAVAAIPEALASIVTIVLSLGTQHLVKHNAIVKELNSVESLGCVSVICSDKTGTLTQNQMIPQYIYFYNQHMTVYQINSQYHDHLVLLKACIICNHAKIENGQKIGDPTELALLELVKQYHQQHPQFQITSTKSKELPFDSDRKLMSVSSLHHLYTKGAYDMLILRCDTILVNGRKEILSPHHIHMIHQQNIKYAKKGHRVLGFAYKDFHKDHINLEDEKHLTFIGLVTMVDPPRKESIEAIKQCQQSGIHPIMITGDHLLTAQSIAQEIGIFKKGDLSIEGKDLEKMNDQDLLHILPSISVYARVTPEHKMKIVKAWQNYGHVVAMTGDGVNDAPALKQSDIGIAMGKSGTEVCKDAAHMIITDDNFATIVEAVMIGRHIYQNIQNSIHYLLSGNFAGIICVLIASLFVLPTPFYPVHLLFMNLITDSLPALAIGMEKENQDVLKEKPRQIHDTLLHKDILFQIGYEGVVIALCTMCTYFIGLKDEPLAASTMAFMTICLARLLHGFNCRSEQSLVQIGIFSNLYSLYAFMIGFLLLNMIICIPLFHSLFMLHSLKWMQLFYIYIFAFIPTIIIQIRKILK